MVDVQYKVSPH